MAKKDSKKKKGAGKKDQATAGAVEAVEAVRSAVERTFAATAEGAHSLRGPAQELAGDVAVAANRIREVLEARVLEELRGLRSDVEGLAKRVAALELGGDGSKSAARSTARKPAARRATTSRAGTSRATTSAGGASRSTSSAAKPAGSRARKAPAKASGADTAAEATAARTTGTRKRAAPSRTNSTRTGGTTSAGRKPSSGAGGTTSGS